MNMLFKNPFVLSLFAAIVVYLVSLNIHNTKEEEKTWFDKESLMYSACAGVLGFTILHFLVNKTSTAGDGSSSPIVQNKPVLNTTRNTSKGLTTTAATTNHVTVGNTGEKVMTDPF